MILPHLFNALAKGNDPDRMKGALYVLGNKGIGMTSPYLDDKLADAHRQLPTLWLVSVVILPYTLTLIPNRLQVSPKAFANLA